MSSQARSQLRSDYVWNTASSVMASASTVIMLLVVTRVAGVSAAGVFALGLAVGQQLQSLGMYEVRTYQATDVAARFSFGTYGALRAVTVLLMLVGIVVYPVLSGEAGSNITLVILIASLRSVDAFEDVFFGEWQRLGRLDSAGKSYFTRVFVTTLVFCVAMVVTGDLLVTTLLTLGVSVLMLLLVVVLPARADFGIRPSFAAAPIRQVLVACFPLFLSAFLAVYLSNAPRFAIATYMDNETQGYFAILFMPAFAVNLLSTLLFRPLLTRMALIWAQRNRRAFRNLLLRGLLGAVAGFVVVWVATYLIGVPLLDWMYAENVGPYRAEMLVLVAGGGFNALSVVLFYALTTLRRQHAVFLGYALAGIVVFVLSLLLVPACGMLGAALAYLCAMLTLTVAFALFFTYFLRRA